MNFKKVDSSTIKCYVSNEELEAYGITVEELTTDKSKARKFINYLLGLAREEIGEIEINSMMTIQIQMIRDKGLLLTITSNFWSELPRELKESLIESMEEHLHQLVQENTDGDEEKEEQERAGHFLYDMIVALRDSSVFAPYFHRQLNYYQSPSNDSKRLEELYSGNTEGQRTLKISCILRPKSTTSIGLLSEGLYYPSSLTYQCFHDNASSSIAKEFKDHILFSADQTKDYGSLFGEMVSDFYQDKLDLSSSLATILQNFSLLTLTVIDDITPYSTTSDISSYISARLELGSDVSFQEGVDLFNPLTYADFVSSITIYPTDYESKLDLIEKMDEYNKGRPESEQVIYTDVGSMATDMVGEIVQVISAVLIAFAAISLVVSSVMISIIIYSSVVERTKEIGILRSIGARKKDVGRLFKAEAIIIGLLSGLFGILCTYLFSLGISAILNSLFPQVALGQICFLNPLHALVLLLVSAFLTYLASLVPSRIAAKKDPVTCLRSE